MQQERIQKQMEKNNFDEILALATKIDQLARDIDPYGYDDAVSDREENISQVAEAMAGTFNFLEAEVAAMEVDFEQGEIDKEVQAWQHCRGNSEMEPCAN